MHDTFITGINFSVTYCKVKQIVKKSNIYFNSFIFVEQL